MLGGDGHHIIPAADFQRDTRGVSPFKGRLMDKIPDAEYKVVEHQIAPATRPLSALAISTTFLSKMARTNEEQQLKANSYLW